MKNLFALLLVLTVNISFSQENIDLKFFEHFKESFYLDGEFLRYDNGIGKDITDTIKNSMLKNKVVRFPMRCDNDLEDYTDYSYCLTGNELESGFLLSTFYVSNNEEDINDVFDIFIKKLDKKIIDNNYEIFSYDKINSKVFTFKRLEDIKVYDPNTLEEIKTIHIEENVYVLLLTMYQ
jgi:hypothetical protein